MEVHEIEKRLEWLDEQRRKDNEEISRLRKRLDGAEEMISTQNGQLKELSTEVARLAGLTTKIQKVDDALAKHRVEVSRQLKEASEARAKRDKQIEEMRKVDQKAVAQRLDELENELGRLDSIEEQLENRREESLRITRELDGQEKRMDGLQAKLEDGLNAFNLLEESQMADHRRVIELQAETVEIRKAAEKAQGELDVIADQIRSLDVRLNELKASENARLEAQNAWIENQGLKIVEFEKEWNQWVKEFQAFETKADEFSLKLSAYEKTYKELMQIRDELNETIDRLERRITEVGEMHRLADERQKKEWAAFQSDDLKRWNTFKLGSDEQWREHNRLHEKLADQFSGLDDDVQKGLATLQELMDTNLLHMKDMVSLLREWASDADRIGKERKP